MSPPLEERSKGAENAETDGVSATGRVRAKAPERDDVKAPERDDVKAPERDDVKAPERDDAKALRRRLAWVWLVAGSAPAAMVGAFCYYTITYDGGMPHGGDMVGHAAAVEWLRTLPWWDWRGWSDWFYGGQAIGVNYPPLGHAWMRFTHPVQGQLAAVAIGLLVLLPWGVLHLARSMGYPPRAQRAAVAAALMLPTGSATMHWLLSGFQKYETMFGSWPAMLSTVIGLHAVAWAARCRRPVAAGVIVGLSVLFNVTPVPGMVVVIGVLLVTSGASFRVAVRWVAIAGAAALAVCSWWLVTFIAGWERLVRWEMSLSWALFFNGAWQVVVLITVCVFVAWAAFRGGVGARRLAVAAASGLLVTVLADSFGYLRAERWLMVPFLTALVAAASLASLEPFWRRWWSVRGVWIMPSVVRLAIFLCLIPILAPIIPLTVLIPVAVWFISLPPRRSWVWSSVLGWTILFAFSEGNIIKNHYHYKDHSLTEEVAANDSDIIEAIDKSEESGVASADNSITGFVYLNQNTHNLSCPHVHPWNITTYTGGRLRTLNGLYRETNTAAEFQYVFDRYEWVHAGLGRPDWDRVTGMRDKSRQELLVLDPVAVAGALGARWLIQYNDDCSAQKFDLPTTTRASSVTIAPAFTEESWHSDAALWWIEVLIGTHAVVSSSDNAVSGNAVEADHTADQIVADTMMMSISDILLTGMPMPQFNGVPILADRVVDHTAYPVDQAASGVSLHTAQDELIVQAETAGWVWLRVPWDPYWRSVSGTPVHKGGPGHLIVWVEQGSTELRWSVPIIVDIVAAVITIVSVLVVVVLTRGGRSRQQFDQSRGAASGGGAIVSGATVIGEIEGGATVPGSSVRTDSHRITES